MIDTLLVTFRRLRGSPTSHRRVKLGVNCSLRRCRASSQSPFRSKPPDGNFSLHSLAPPFQTEPASLGFGLGYCAGATRAGRVETWQPADESSFCRRPQRESPSARGLGWGLAQRRLGSYKAGPRPFYWAPAMTPRGEGTISWGPWYRPPRVGVPPPHPAGAQARRVYKQVGRKTAKFSPGAAAQKFRAKSDFLPRRFCLLSSVPCTPVNGGPGTAR